MNLIINPNGNARCLYDETIDLAELGGLTISRGSHVEADPQGQWTGDLSPVGGPHLGPYACRSAALAAERRWLEAHWLCMPGGRSNCFGVK